MSRIRKPEVRSDQIQPFTDEQIAALLNASPVVYQN
jgi:hypothetical protein